VRFAPEPLVDHADRQSIRVDAAQPLSQAIVRTRAGVALDAPVRPTPTGLRILVPVADSTSTFTVELPELGPGAPVEVVVTPVRKWNVHVVYHSHLDIGYSD